MHIPDALNYAGSIVQDGALADRHQVVFLAEVVTSVTLYICPFILDLIHTGSMYEIEAFWTN